MPQTNDNMYRVKHIVFTNENGDLVEATPNQVQLYFRGVPIDPKLAESSYQGDFPRVQRKRKRESQGTLNGTGGKTETKPNSEPVKKTTK